MKASTFRPVASSATQPKHVIMPIMTKLSPSECAILRRSAAQLRRGSRANWSIGQCLAYCEANYALLRNSSGEVAGFCSLQPNYLSFDLTPKGIGQFGWSEAQARKEFIDA